MAAAIPVCLKADLPMKFYADRHTYIFMINTHDTVIDKYVILCDHAELSPTQSQSYPAVQSPQLIHFERDLKLEDWA